MYYQKPTRGGRRKLYSGVDKQVERRVEQDAIRYNCSKSFVSNTILARYYHIVIEENYDRINRPSETRVLRGKRKNQVSPKGKKRD